MRVITELVQIHVVSEHDLSLIFLQFFNFHSQITINLSIKMLFLLSKDIIFINLHLFFHIFSYLIFDTLLLNFIFDIINIIVKIFDFFSLLDVSLFEDFGTVFHLW
jgi:hypothetical protein